MLEQETKNTTNTLTGIMFATIMLGIVLLVVGIVLGVLSTSSNQISGTLVNDTLINVTGYGTSIPINGTCGTCYDLSAEVAPETWIPIQSGYGIYYQTNCIMYANESYNPFPFPFNPYSGLDWNVTCPYTTYQNIAEINDIKTNVIGTVENFFALMPVVGTIFAIVILIAGIVLLVLYVRRMKSSGTEGMTG